MLLATTQHNAEHISKLLKHLDVLHSIVNDSISFTRENIKVFIEPLGDINNTVEEVKKLKELQNISYHLSELHNVIFQQI